MGNYFNRLTPGSKSANVLVFGLYGSGKTELLNKALCGHYEAIHLVSTVGVTIIRMSQLEFNINVYDLGGSDECRKIWNLYYKKAHAIIFVVDGTNHIEIARTGFTFQCLMDEPSLSKIPVLILVNKQDIVGAMTAVQVSNALNISKIRDRLWEIKETSALTGEGIQTAFDWLSRAFTKTTLSNAHITRLKRRARA